MPYYYYYYCYYLNRDIFPATGLGNQIRSSSICIKERDVSSFGLSFLFKISFSILTNLVHDTLRSRVSVQTCKEAPLCRIRLHNFSKTFFLRDQNLFLVSKKCIECLWHVCTRTRSVKRPKRFCYASASPLTLLMLERYRWYYATLATHTTHASTNSTPFFKLQCPWRSSFVDDFKRLAFASMFPLKYLPERVWWKTFSLKLESFVVCNIGEKTATC